MEAFQAGPSPAENKLAVPSTAGRRQQLESVRQTGSPLQNFLWRAVNLSDLSHPLFKDLLSLLWKIYDK